MPDVKSTFGDALRSAAEDVPVALTDGHVDLMFQHYQAMLEANERTNLTRITEPAVAARRHYADSLAIIPWADRMGIESADVLDVGTGAGFPAIPLSITRPDWSLTALDGTGKKVAFLTEVASQLALENLEPIHAHSEHWKAPRPFDLVVLRAVARLGKALATAARHVRRGGWIVIYKTASLPEDELRDGRSMAKEYKLLEHEPFSYSVCDGEDMRSLALRPFQRRA